MPREGSALNIVRMDDPSATGETKDLFLLIRSGVSYSGRERNCAFLNTGGERFAGISAVSGVDFPDDGRAIALTDWDHDGDLDAWIVNRSGPQVRFLRNNNPLPNRWLSVRLEGRSCNRDAIGARVEVTANGQKWIKSLRAGDAFLSQSGKRLHFGLGAADTVAEVTVRWPNGRIQRHAGLQPNRHYHIVEEEPDARAEPRRPGSVSLQPGPLAASDPPPHRGQFLSTRVLFPRVEYNEMDGTPATPRDMNNRALLINFWASWCAPCRSELREWTAAAPGLRQAGLDVLALSVDGLSMSKQSAPADAKRFLDSISFPFESGVATADLLDKIETLQRYLFDMHIPFAVPTSFLLDEKGQLSAICRGPVEIETLRRHLSTPDDNLEESFARSVPFPGRFAAITTFEWIGLARGFREKFPDEERRYLRFAIDRQTAELTVKQNRGMDTRGTKMKLVSTYGVLAGYLLNDGDVDQAAALHEAAYNVAPQDPRLERLALDIAIARAERSLESTADPVNDHLNLADLLVRRKRFEVAINHYGSALELDPDISRAHSNRAQLLTLAGRIPEAIVHYREVIRLLPDRVRALNDLAWLLATHPDAAVRNGGEAVELALRACELTGRRDPGTLNTLAAAYAEAGRFHEAVETAQAALLLAVGEDEVAGIESRLALYRDAQPFRQAPRPIP